MAKVSTPVEGFTGTVIGVSFVDGSGESDAEGQLAYFERHGYTISSETVKPLAELTKSELESIAQAEGVKFKSPINKPDLVALIQANRPE